MNFLENVKTLPEEIFWEPKRMVRPDWVGHIPFLFYLMNEFKPRLYVELGVFHGDSYCAACQITREYQLPTKLVGIDCWMGDIHIGNYDEDVLQKLKSHHDPLYTEISKLEKGFFHEKLSLFDDESIELLHIDGEHTYEAVKQDFETWLPKVSKQRGIVLFHDTNVFGRDDFGVWKLWDELINSGYKGIRFPHCNGLGVLCVSPLEKLSPQLQSFFSLNEADQKILFSLFATLGKRHELEAWSNLNSSILQQQIQSLQSQVQHPQPQPDALDQSLIIELRSKMAAQKQRIQRLVEEKDKLKNKNSELKLRLHSSRKTWFKRLFAS